ncbi:MAG: family 78 glycoside hydrolase catalytic domain, partial [Phycisphaerae bacterium]
MTARRLWPECLRCEYRIDPLGIDVKRPRLSWIVESDRRCQKQTAYRILVASSEVLLAADKGDLWDSGKVASDATAQIVYAGGPLRSRMRCWWKVRVWDASGRPSAWSSPAAWTMGLLREADWKQARWIGFDEPGIAPAAGKKLFLPPPRYLRKGFHLDRPVRRATVYATALGLYELRVNGREVGDDWFTPGCTDYDKRVYYQTYDVTGLLQQGDNAIGGILADGWYAGYMGWGWRREMYGRKTRLRAQLHVEYADGTAETVVTDGSWRAATGPIREADFLMGEACDARMEMPGWDAPGFDAAAWRKVNVTARIKAAVQAVPGPTVKAFAELTPVKVAEPRPGRFVFDLGRNFAGVVRLKVAAARRGKRIVLRFAERLKPDGTIYTRNLRGARATDTYYCRGGREETWQPRFTFHGFQYVEVTGYPGRPKKDAITGVALSSDTPVVGGFECSDEAANRLYGNICWTQRANFIDIPTDCPQRDERLGWTGDAQVYMRTATCIADVAAFFTKWLVDLDDAQGPAGEYPDVAPRRVATGGGTAAWADAGIICPWTIHRVYGDERVLRRHYVAMARFIEYCRESTGGTLLRPEAGYGDWLSIKADTPKDVLATAYFAHSTHLFSRVAAALGRKADAAKYNRLFEDIRAAFNKAYVADDGRIRGDTQTVYV